MSAARRRPPRFRVRALAALAVALLAAGGLAAQEPPSPEQVLGYGIGERFTDVAGVERYMRALADASERVAVREYGRTPEGRPLIQVLVASREHRDRLEEVLAANRELTRPDTPAGRAREIAAANPAVVYFSYGIHGNESSSSEAAMWTAWDLARSAPEVEGVLDSLIVVLDPVVNPDGRDRYVGFYRGARGAEPNPDPAAREHREPWPGGRYNHYLFDLNRDWAWMSQSETRDRLATWDRWNPQVHVDFHEMSPNSTYFFFPPTPPVNPIYPEHVLEWGRRFGQGNAAAFDREGWLYFTSETYDLFYPGYGDSWPAALGTVGMTYEQAGGGSAGLVRERPDGSRLTLRDRAQHHRTTGRATLRTAAADRTDLVEGFARTYREVDAGLSDVVLVPSEGDPGPAAALVELLLDQGIRVERAVEAFGADAEPHPGYDARSSFPSGSYRVPVRQSRGRLAAALLRPDNPLNAEFSYDITAWSLPYAYGVEAHSLSGEPDAAWSEVEDPPDPAGPAGEVAVERVRGEIAEPPYGYLMLPGFERAPALVDFLEEGGRAYALADTFSLGGVDYPRGTVFLPRGRNPGLDDRVREAGLERFLVPVATGRTSGGPDLGTADADPLSLPRIALLGGEGTRPTSFGAHWFFLDRRLDVPHDVIEVADVRSVALPDYDVVVVPGTSGLRDRLGDAGAGALEDWVRAGGVIVAADDGAREVAELLADVEPRETLEDEEDPDRGERLDRALRTREQREAERWRESMPGAILPVTLDPRHPFAYGAGAGGRADRMFVLSAGEVFEPSGAFESPAFFPADVDAVSGVVSRNNLERMARGSWLVDRRVGDGRVILFADDPLFRMFWYGGFQLFTNALLLGPA